MELFGESLQTIYLYSLIISGVLTVLYVLFGDMLEGLFEGIPFVNPTLIFAFITIFSAESYLLELYSPINSFLIMLISAVSALILVTLLNVFVLVPLSSAESSLAYKESDLRGRIGTVITPIPKDGFGEVLIESVSGKISKTAASFKNEEIEYGKKVLIIETKDGVVHVLLHEEPESIF